MRLKETRQAPDSSQPGATVPSVWFIRPDRATLIIVSWSLLPRAPGAGLALSLLWTSTFSRSFLHLPTRQQVNLPRFKYAHPRLPSPSAADLATIVVRNPDFLRQIRIRAAGGSGDIEAAALQELIDPGSVDLDLLHRRLLELKFTDRGHEQGKPLAVAYDWLYGRLERTAARAAAGQAGGRLRLPHRADPQGPHVAL